MAVSWVASAPGDGGSGLSADRLPSVYVMHVPWFREDSLTTAR